VLLRLYKSGKININSMTLLEGRNWKSALSAIINRRITNK